MVLAQALAGLAAGLVGWVWVSPMAGLAALVGALALSLGTLVLARFALGGGVRSGEAVMLRMVAGMLLKWLVVAAVLLMAVGVWRLSPLPIIVGVAGAFVASALAALFKH